MKDFDERFNEWKKSYISQALEKKRKNAIEKIVCSSIDDNKLTVVQKNTIEKILKKEYRKHLSDEEIKGLSKKLIEKNKEKNKSKSAELRKKRAHNLISIGALIEVAGFPSDRGTILGAYDYILNKSKSDPNLMSSLKAKGDEILALREAKKKQ